MNIINHRVLLGTVACSLLAIGGPIVSAQGPQLTRIGAFLAEDGFRATHTRLTGRLDSGDSTTHTVWLQYGVSYTLRGTCDRDCTDLDLELRSPNGHLLDSDLDPDDIPQVGTTARVSGFYSVRVVMASCSITPCSYAVGIFGR